MLEFDDLKTYQVALLGVTLTLLFGMYYEIPLVIDALYATKAFETAQVMSFLDLSIKGTIVALVLTNVYTMDKHGFRLDDNPLFNSKTQAYFWVGLVSSIISMAVGEALSREILYSLEFPLVQAVGVLIVLVVWRVNGEIDSYDVTKEWPLLVSGILLATVPLGA